MIRESRHLLRATLTILTIVLGVSTQLPANQQCCLGDLDEDGRVTGLDLQSFALLLSGDHDAGSSCQADFNQDDSLDEADIGPFVMALLQAGMCPPPNCPLGDMNSDHILSGSDVPLFVHALISDTEFDCRADLNSDGVLDAADVPHFVARLLYCPQCPQSRILHVSTLGNDDNDGSRAMPLRTIQTAALIADAGDTIRVRGGTYVESHIRFATSGVDGAPITVEGYPGEAVIVTSGSSAKWIFDFTDHFCDDMAGFGHYVFRKFKAHGSRHVWRFAFSDEQDRPNNIMIESVEAWDCGSVIAARGSGVAYLTVRNADFHHSTGTEGNIDLGNNLEVLDTPGAGSHDILIADSVFHDSRANQQTNGLVTQGSVSRVTLINCRSWNNGKYGFALKGSGDFVVDRCAAWGNGSSQFYVRGMIASDPLDRTVSAANQVTLTNCIAIAPRDAGGAGLVWREGADLKAYHCTIVSLRDETLTNNGEPFANNERHVPPHVAIRADVRNCAIVTHDGTPVRLFQGNNLPYLQNRVYFGDNNLFYRLGGGSSTSFKYQGQNWTSLALWQGYWANGEPAGDDLLNGPIANQADANSLWADPMFKFVGLNARVPLAGAWSVSFADVIDVHPLESSSLLGGGANLSHLGLQQLSTDYNGVPRPASGPWSIGAFETTH